MCDYSGRLSCVASNVSEVFQGYFLEQDIVRDVCSFFFFFSFGGGGGGARY